MIENLKEIQKMSVDAIKIKLASFLNYDTYGKENQIRWFQFLRMKAE